MSKFENYNVGKTEVIMAAILLGGFVISDIWQTFYPNFLFSINKPRGGSSRTTLIFGALISWGVILIFYLLISQIFKRLKK